MIPNGKLKLMKPPQGPLDLSIVRFPCYASIKYDGFRCAVVNGKTVLNSLAEVANDYTRNKLMEAADVLDRHDGELVMLPLNDNRCFNRCQSAFRRKADEPDFRYVVFDRIDTAGFEDRWVKFDKPKYPDWVIVDEPVLITCREQLDAYVEEIVSQGHEGVILRSPSGLYLYKRSSFNSQEVLRIKPMETDEGVVVDFECEYENRNEATVDALGHTKRSSSKAGLVPKDTLGKLILDTKFGRIAVSGFDDDLADEIWRNKARYLGEIATYSYQAVGTIDKPRIAKFNGFRAKADMS